MDASTEFNQKHCNTSSSKYFTTRGQGAVGKPGKAGHAGERGIPGNSGSPGINGAPGEHGREVSINTQ